MVVTGLVVVGLDVVAAGFEPSCCAFVVSGSAEPFALRSDERKRHLDPSVMIIGKLSAEKKKLRDRSLSLWSYMLLLLYFS